MSLARRILLFLFFATFSNLLIAQTIVIHRPTQDGGDYNNPANAFDGNSATFSQFTGSGQVGFQKGIESWHGFSAASGSPSKIVLKVTSSVNGVSPCTADLEYATDGGQNQLTYTTVYAATVRSQRTDDITLLNSQDLTQVWVRADVDCPDGARAGEQSNIYEIWIEVTE